MKIHLYTNTLRGAIVLKHLRMLVPDAEIKIAIGTETPYEPPFVEAISTGPHNGLIDDPSCDLLLAVHWRKKISSMVYYKAKFAAVMHDSLLPKWRGFSPLVNAMLAGDREVGVTMIKMAEVIDAGPIIAQKKVTVADRSIGNVMQDLTDKYLEILSETVPLLAGGWLLDEVEQKGDPTYGRKIDWDKERFLDKRAPAYIQDRHKRVFTSPYPQWEYK